MVKEKIMRIAFPFMVWRSFEEDCGSLGDGGRDRLAYS